MNTNTTSPAVRSTLDRPLRLRPGVIAVSVQWVSILGVALFAPDLALFAMMAALGCGVVVAVWWLFFSRAPWIERIGAIVLMVAAVTAIRRVVDPSIAGAGMGYLLPIFSIPAMSLGLVVWAVASRRVTATGVRFASMTIAMALAAGLLATLRTDGVTGDGNPQLRWRWTPTAEEKLLIQADAAPPAPVSVQPAAAAPAAAPPASLSTTALLPTTAAPDKTMVAPAEAAAAAWPGFRGPARDSVLRNARIDTDWSKAAPAELWRRPIGPGWSSFAVHGNFVYTQEQRGEDEMVSCYDLRTGEPVWGHADAARFYESNGGPGPRGTPTLSGGRVYTLGATGILNVLDAETGARIWSRNAADDTGAKLPGWGFTSSPLVLRDAVIVSTSGVLTAYDAATGTPRWVGPRHGVSYSSPQVLTIDGVEQVMLLSATGAIGLAPADGAVLWAHEWPGGSIVQPAMTADGDVLINSISMMGGVGVRRLAIRRGPPAASGGAAGAWTVEERWTSNGLKPYFNDFVVHKGHAYGFDGSILSSIDLADGARKWKGGRYGNGQMILLADQDLLLVLSEEGELALVSATPDKYTEIARVKAIEGKTWNHPVLVGDILLVRNGDEMAAFRLRP